MYGAGLQSPCLSLEEVTDALEHRAQLLPSVVLEACDDEHALGHLFCPVPLLMVTTTDVKIVASDIVEPQGRMAQDGYLMMVGEWNPAAMTDLLYQTDIVGAEDLPASLVQFQAEVEIDTIDEQFFRETADALPGLEPDQVARCDAMSDKFRTMVVLGM